MTNINTLIEIEEIFLNIDNDLKYELSLNDLIKLNQYLKEIGEITNLFFSIQIDYGKKFEDKQYLIDYHDKLISEDLDIETDNYKSFIEKIIPLITEKSYYEKAKTVVNKL